MYHLCICPLRSYTDDGSFGASLSYASSDGKSAAASPQTLANKMIEDNVEVIVMSDKNCEDGGCGYTRPGGVNYREYWIAPLDRLDTDMRLRWIWRRSQALYDGIFHAKNRQDWFQRRYARYLAAQCSDSTDLTIWYEPRLLLLDLWLW